MVRSCNSLFHVAGSKPSGGKIARHICWCQFARLKTAQSSFHTPACVGVHDPGRTPKVHRTSGIECRSLEQLWQYSSSVSSTDAWITTALVAWNTWDGFVLGKISNDTRKVGLLLQSEIIPVFPQTGNIYTFLPNSCHLSTAHDVKISTKKRDTKEQMARRCRIPIQWTGKVLI